MTRVHAELPGLAVGIGPMPSLLRTGPQLAMAAATYLRAWTLGVGDEVGPVVAATAIDGIGATGADHRIIAVAHQGILKVEEAFTDRQGVVGNTRGHVVVIVAIVITDCMMLLK